MNNEAALFHSGLQNKHKEFSATVSGIRKQKCFIEVQFYSLQKPAFPYPPRPRASGGECTPQSEVQSEGPSGWLRCGS